MKEGGICMKKSVTVNLMPEILNIMEENSSRLKISRNTLIESATILTAYERKFLVQSPDEIATIVDNFSTNQNSKITAEFRQNIKAMPTIMQWAICTFISGIILIPNMRITTQKMANLWKDGEVICYFAMNKIGGRNIESVIKNLSVESLTETEEATSGVVYFSRLQQFRINNQYARWDDFLLALSLPPSTDVIKVDSDNLIEKILPALAEI